MLVNERSPSRPLSLRRGCTCSALSSGPQPLRVTKALTLAGHSEQQLRPVSHPFWNAGWDQALCDVSGT